MTKKAKIVNPLLDTMKYFYRVREFFPLPEHDPAKCGACTPALIGEKDSATALVKIIGHLMRQAVNAEIPILTEILAQEEADRRTYPHNIPVEQFAKEWRERKPKAVRCFLEYLDFYADSSMETVLNQHLHLIERKDGTRFTEKQVQKIRDAAWREQTKIEKRIAARLTVEQEITGFTSESRYYQSFGSKIKRDPMVPMRPMMATMSEFMHFCARDVAKKDHAFAKDPKNKDALVYQIIKEKYE